MARTSTHVIETESRLIFESKITHYSNDEKGIAEGDLLFRFITERDYGIDGDVELFEKGEETGRIARVQIKGTGKRIEKLKTDDAVSCSHISKANLGCCRQNNLPVILVYCSVCDKEFYYIDLQSVFQYKIDEIADNFSGTVRIPIVNNSRDLTKFVDIINSYYDHYAKKQNFERHDNKSKGRRFIIDFHRFGEETHSYVFDHYYDKPSDGEHKEIGTNGCTMAVGYWENGKLQYGTEYNWLIRVVQGKLYNEGKTGEYEYTPDFDYEKMEQYGWASLGIFDSSDAEVDYYGENDFFVVDFDIRDEYEQMKNIIPLKMFLNEKSIEVESKPEK